MLGNEGSGWGPGWVAFLMGCFPYPGRYHRLPLPEQGAPLEAQFDTFVSVLRVSGGRGGAREHCMGAGTLGSVSVEMLRVAMTSSCSQRRASFHAVWVQCVGVYYLSVSLCSMCTCFCVSVSVYALSVGVYLHVLLCQGLAVSSRGLASGPCSAMSWLCGLRDTTSFPDLPLLVSVVRLILVPQTLLPVFTEDRWPICPTSIALFNLHRTRDDQYRPGALGYLSLLDPADTTILLLPTEVLHGWAGGADGTVPLP